MPPNIGEALLKNPVFEPPYFGWLVISWGSTGPLRFPSSYACGKALL